MNEIINMIMSLFEKLTDEEKASINSALSGLFERPIPCFISELSTFNEEELVVTKNTINGLILTRENVPNLLEAYERLKNKDLPQKVSFGHLTVD
ncbi:hypothetical protein [Paenibacillus sp. Cedars]|uniref:hypothetical protein n=1 Tax=Paenibacillus sp. Cedars TaxID=1980674 RepID=UPI001162AB84|nr:hypothetical protein [Paenibacillus sp. Cedars]AWP27511.1 hypothetical protein B9D94_13135 [Paenibacillus sp. Cedars]